MANLVQRGTFSMSAGSTVPDGGSPAPSGGIITLPTPVTEGKAAARITVRGVSGGVLQRMLCTVELTDVVDGEYTTLTITRGLGSVDAMNGTWEVVEKDEWTVQQVPLSLSSVASNTASITSVTTTESMIWASWRGDQNAADNMLVRWDFASSTSLRAQRANGGGTVTGNAFVISWDGATIQHVTVSMTGGGSDSVDTAITELDDLAKAFVEYTYSVDNNTGEAARVLVEAEITSPTNLQTRRGAASSDGVTLQAQIVSHPDISVQSKQASMADAAGSYNTPALDTAVDTTLAFVAVPMMGNAHSANTATDSEDTGLHTQELTGDSEVTGTRGDTTGVLDATFYVVEFTAEPPERLLPEILTDLPIDAESLSVQTPANQGDQILIKAPADEGMFPDERTLLIIDCRDYLPASVIVGKPATSTDLVEANKDSTPGVVTGASILACLMPAGHDNGGADYVFDVDATHSAGLSIPDVMAYAIRTRWVHPTDHLAATPTALAQDSDDPTGDPDEIVDFPAVTPDATALKSIIFRLASTRRSGVWTIDAALTRVFPNDSEAARYATGYEPWEVTTEAPARTAFHDNPFEGSYGRVGLTLPLQGAPDDGSPAAVDVTDVQAAAHDAVTGEVTVGVDADEVNVYAAADDGSVLDPATDTLIDTLTATGTFFGTGLTADTTYRIYAAAENANGTTIGNPVRITTFRETLRSYTDDALIDSLDFAGLTGPKEVRAVAGKTVAAEAGLTRVVGVTIEVYDDTPTLVASETFNALALDDEADLAELVVSIPGSWNNDTLSVDVTAVIDTGDPDEVGVALFTVAMEEADVTAPVLSNATATATGPTTADASVTTDEGNGSIDWVVTESATSPSGAQVQGGQDHTGAGAAGVGSKNVTQVGQQDVSPAGLAAGTTYYIHFVQEDDAGNISNVASSASFVTDPGAADPGCQGRPTVLLTTFDWTAADFDTYPAADCYPWGEEAPLWAGEARGLFRFNAHAVPARTHGGLASQPDIEARLARSIPDPTDPEGEVYYWNEYPRVFHVRNNSGVTVDAKFTRTGGCVGFTQQVLDTEELAIGPFYGDASHVLVQIIGPTTATGGAPTPPAGVDVKVTAPTVADPGETFDFSCQAPTVV